VTGGVAWVGYAARFFAAILWHSPGAFRRLHLTLREIYFSGVLSLVIILTSGLFVGMVLSLQGYEVLVRYGADEQLGIVVALSLVRELGPVLAGLLFASRAGSAITAEIGLMKATEQLSAMEMMAVDPISLGVVGQLIRRLNDALGITSVVVTHDVYESLKIVDYLYFVSDGKIVAEGTPDEVRASTDLYVRQFVDGQPDGPVPFHYPAPSYRDTLLADVEA